MEIKDSVNSTITRLHLRLDSVNSNHVQETLFMDGINCGQLCFDHGGYQEFGACLLLGASLMKRRVVVEVDEIGWDKDGNFIMPEHKSVSPQP